MDTMQYMQRKVTSFGEFNKYVEYFVNVVADYQSDFVVFPELMTLQLLSIEDQALSPYESIEALTKYTPQLKERSEEHTSELQSRGHLVCRLLLEKKKQKRT